MSTLEPVGDLNYKVALESKNVIDLIYCFLTILQDKLSETIQSNHVT